LDWKSIATVAPASTRAIPIITVWRLIGESNGSTTNLFLTDGLGSVITTISATAGNASVQGNQAYGPYGNTQYQAGAMGTAKGFTGQYQDATALDYYNARYYDPVVGRFLSADTVQGNGMGMDPYAYVGGNPETNTDPTGQAYCSTATCEETAGGGPAPTDGDGNGNSPCNSGTAIQGCDPELPAYPNATVDGTTYAFNPTNGDINVSSPTFGATYYPGSWQWIQALGIIFGNQSLSTQPPPPVNSVSWQQSQANQNNGNQGNQSNTSNSTSINNANNTGWGGGPAPPTPPATVAQSW
jgi:RHS repeat-associated protein